MKEKNPNKKKVTFDEVKARIYNEPIPENWREGQFVFNRAEELYGKVARDVQFIDKVDCFFRDADIDKFIEYVCVRLNREK